MISPCALFYFFAITRQAPDYFESDYISASAWFYAYVSSSVALFGFAFYIIGRRESGFIRSFIYSKKSKNAFVFSHFLAYSVISVFYCLTFYLVTKIPFGNYDFIEVSTLIIRFYICFIMFCSFGTILTLLPINFQNSNTLLSVLSFFMLIFGVIGASELSTFIHTINLANPLAIANQIMANDLNFNKSIIVLIIFSAIMSAFILLRYLRINPVWSRY